MDLHIAPEATSLKDFRELDDSVVWVLRGAGLERNQPMFLPGTYGAQLAGMLWNTVHPHAAKHRAYPFPIRMTDFVVLYLCTGSFGAQAFSKGAGGARFHEGRTLVLNDLALKEDIPEEWYMASSLTKHHVWPAGNVPRSKMRVGGYSKAEDFIKQIRALAMVVREFYNEVSEGFATLAAVRDEGEHVVWPLDLLAVSFEKLMQQFILCVREQIMQLLITLEQTRKDTKRPNLFTNLRLLMLSRDHAMRIAFVVPGSFVNVTADTSAFQRA